MLTAEQVIASHKANVETLLGLTSKAFEGVEKIVELNLSASKAALTESAEHAKALLSVKDAQELMQLLCAADVYVQPGSQSATLQNSICCRCAVIVDDVPSHHPFVNGNGWMVHDAEALVQAFDSAIHAFQDGRLEQMRAQ